MAELKYKLGADQIDWRDRYYNFAKTSLRESVDLRPMATDIEQQSKLGSCTSQAIVGAYELMLKRDFPESFVELSPLFLYYNARLQDGTINEDIGAYPRDAIKAAKLYGICRESLWPYNISNFKVRPTDECYKDALNYSISKYYRLSTVDNITDALNADCPVVAGITVFDEFDEITTANPILKMPRNENQQPIGAHAILFVGYDLNKKLILARNSFGKNWGENGYFWIPFEYCKEYLTDAWVFDIKLTKTS